MVPMRSPFSGAPLRKLGQSPFPQSLNNHRTTSRNRREINMHKLQTKQLGNSDMSITPVGFGAWAIGGSGWQFGWGEQDDKQSVAAIHRALELGVNWIDT